MALPPIPCPASRRAPCAIPRLHDDLARAWSAPAGLRDLEFATFEVAPVTALGTRDPHAHLFVRDVPFRQQELDRADSAPYPVFRQVQPRRPSDPDHQVTTIEFSLPNGFGTYLSADGSLIQ